MDDLQGSLDFSGNVQIPPVSEQTVPCLPELSEPPAAEPPAKNTRALTSYQLAIIRIIETAGRWLTAEEVTEHLKYEGFKKSGNGVATELWRLEAHHDRLVSRFCKGKTYKQWNLKEREKMA
jgi:hypothetical protein